MAAEVSSTVNMEPDRPRSGRKRNHPRIVSQLMTPPGLKNNTPSYTGPNRELSTTDENTLGGLEALTPGNDINEWLPESDDVDYDFKQIRVFEDKAGPSIRIPQILNFLRDQDKDRAIDWERRLKDVEDYLEYADDLRKKGDKTFQPYLKAALEEAQVLVEVHRNFESWNYDKTRWSQIELPKPYNPVRLPQYPQQQHIPCTGKGNNRPLRRRVAMLPRPAAIGHAPFLNDAFGSNADWDAYFKTTRGHDFVKGLSALLLHEKQLWMNQWGKHATRRPLGTTESLATDDSLKSPDNPNGINYSYLENEVYERCIEGGLSETVKRAPLRHGEELRGGQMLTWATNRGWRRAAVQQCLNLFSNSENRALNTPWRRVVLPEPLVENKLVVYHPRTMPRSSNQEFSELHPAEREPSPWIFWYNQYLEQITYLSAWNRRALNKAEWNNFKQIALPINFQGPYTFSNRCVYDDYWLGTGPSLLLLQKSLERANGMQVPGQRPILPTILQDIADGMAGRPRTAAIMPREGVDTLPQQPESFQLVDEVDTAWLKYLCIPATCRAWVETESESVSQLVVLFDHRLQTMFKDTITSPFWEESQEIQERTGSVFPRYERRPMALGVLLPMLNYGGRQRVPFDRSGEHWTWVAADVVQQYEGHQPPNELYQFSIDEATQCCLQLAHMGRIMQVPS